ncbi:MAG: YceI family protein [Wenzhouxiangella sp.]
MNRLLNCLTVITATLVLSVSFAAPLLAAPETYIIDDSHTYPSFSWNHFGLSTQQARFNRTTGTITIDREALTGSVDIEIDMTSVNTGYPDFDEHIQGEGFFNTAEFPTATFRSTEVHFDGDTPVSVDGELTINGVTRPVTLEINSFTAMVHPMVQRPAIGANASTNILRSDFDAGQFVPSVSDEVRIDIAMEAIQPE